jgi:hypothetical protein
MDEYLPKDTLDFCESALAEQGIDLSSLQSSAVTDSGSRLHKEAYLILRKIVTAHDATRPKISPILTMCPKIIGGAMEAQSTNSRLGQLIHENYQATFLSESIVDVAVEQMIIEGEDVEWINKEFEEENQ